MKEKVQLTKEIKRTILLNPGPGTTSVRVKKSLLVEDICPREEEFGQVIHEIEKGLLKIPNATQSHSLALFGASGTGAMEATLTSAIGPSDHLLILANGAYGIRMRAICDRFGIRSSMVGAFGHYPDLNELETLLRSGDYSHLAIIHHETSTGMMNPLDEISVVCGSYDVKLIVDAMSTFGAYPYDLQKTSVDYIFSSSNKCLHGMAGLAFVLFSERCKQELVKNSRGFYFDVYQQWSHFQQTGQLRFTPPVQICYALKEAIDETIETGIQERWNRYQNNWKILFDGLGKLGFTFYLNLEHQSKILLAINLSDQPQLDFNHLHNFLLLKGIIIYPGVIPETKTFRVAVIGDLTSKDMKDVVAAFEDYFEAREE